MSKLADFLNTKKIDSRRVLATSKALEQIGNEDRAIRLLKSKAKTDEKAKAAVAGKERKSGRAVSTPTLDLALAGKPVSGPAKTKILRAVNHLLETKKQSAVQLKDLF